MLLRANMLYWLFSASQYPKHFSYIISLNTRGKSMLQNFKPQFGAVGKKKCIEPQLQDWQGSQKEEHRTEQKDIWLLSSRAGHLSYKISSLANEEIFIGKIALTWTQVMLGLWRLVDLEHVGRLHIPLGIHITSLSFSFQLSLSLFKRNQMSIQVFNKRGNSLTNLCFLCIE